MQTDTMTLYHGTTSIAAEAIKKEGLRWDVPNRLHTKFVDWDGTFDQPDAGDKFVRAADNQTLAGWYARFRYEYAKLEPGTHKDFEVKYKDRDRIFDLVKAPTEPKLRPKERPVIVKLEVPKEFVEAHGQEDPQDSYGALMFNVPIPAEYVKEVVPVKVPKR